MPRVPPTLERVGTLPPPAPMPRDYEPPEPPARVRRRLWPWLLLALALLAVSPLLMVLALRWLPPPTSAFMLQSPVKPVQYRWVPMAQIAPALARAAVASEDQKFFEHNGFDFEAIEKALARNRNGKKIRGASTITQQVAKNLFLWPSRSYLRKGLEVGATLAIEALWPKQRILEVYLNIAEFGPGVYGAEAAAQALFRKPAARLSAAEAAQLVAVLPNPRKWKAARPGPYVQRRTDWILGQLGLAPRYAAVPAEEPVADGLDDIPRCARDDSPDCAAAPAATDDPAAADSEIPPAAAESPGHPAAAESPGHPAAAESPGHPAAAESPGHPEERSDEGYRPADDL